MFGHGGRYWESMPTYLEKFLSTGALAMDIKTFNAGYPGYNALESALQYKFLLRPFNPDLIVWQLCVNDIEIIATGRGQGFQEALRRCWESDVHQLKYFDLAFRILRDEAPCPIVALFAGPPEFEVNFTAAKTVEAHCRKYNFHFINGMETYQLLPSPSRMVSPHNGHPSARLNMLLAKQVVNYVKKHGLLASQTKSLKKINGSVGASGTHAHTATKSVIDSWRAMVRHGNPLDVGLIHELVFFHESLAVVDDARMERELTQVIERRLTASVGEFENMNHIERTAKEIDEIAVELRETMERLPELGGTLLPPRLLAEGFSLAWKRIPKCDGSAFPDRLRTLAGQLAIRMRILLNNLKMNRLLSTLALVKDSTEGEVTIQIEFHPITNTKIVSPPGAKIRNKGHIRLSLQVVEPHINFRTTWDYVPFDEPGVQEHHFPIFALGHLEIELHPTTQYKALKEIRLTLGGKSIGHWRPSDYLEGNIIRIENVGLLVNTKINNATMDEANE